MTNNNGSKDKSLEALDFIINVIKEHEQTLDRSINELATVTEQIGVTDVLNSKVDKVEEKINNLQKEITNLIGYLSTATKEALPATAKQQESQGQAAPAELITSIQGGLFVILRCNHWEDFQVLAMHAQMLSFSYREDEKVFQAKAIKGNQIVAYAGSLPNFLLVLKTWLSQQFEIAEQNIFEGF
jgi:hypothetical protein